MAQVAKSSFPMTKPVKLSNLIAASELPDDWGAWLDRETGEVVTLDPVTIAAGEEAADDAGEADDFLDGGAIGFYDEQALAAARAIAREDARYLALPDRFDFHEYRHMERWVAGIAEPRAAEQLWRAIKGKGAFRHFKDTAHRLGVIDDWFAYRQDAMERHLLRWAEAHGITVDRA